MNILEFNSKFPDELSCVNYLRDLRIKQGIVCKCCKVKTNHYWLTNIEKFQCSICKSRTNLTSGTMMFKSKIPLLKWFMCIHLMTTSKKPFSCLELQRQLGFKFYQPVWDMMRKIRIMMGKRDGKYQLKGTIEMDEGFFEVVNLPKKDELGNIIDEVKSLSRGRGSERQCKVLVTVESEPIEHEFKHKKKRVMGYVKMEVIDNSSSEVINNEVKKLVNKDSHIVTDSWNGYVRLKEVVSNHTRILVKPKESMEKLPWVHTVISNCKRQLLGVHHSIGKDYLQLYLNEFCYKINRRNFIYRDNFDGVLLSSLDGTTL